MNTFRLGFVVNPLAGIGGTVALKGSDGADTVAEAIKRGAHARVPERCAQFFERLATTAAAPSINIITCPGLMGQELVQAAGLDCEVLGETPAETSAKDTQAAVRTFQDAGVDLIVFAGGDGTARDICDVIRPDQPVLGLPSGVKMHSGVFAISPRAAAEIVNEMATGQLTSVAEGEVRDIDESAMRQGVVKAEYYGQMLVPEELRYLQHVKSGGKEVESLVLDDMAAEVVDAMEPGVAYFIGAGTTTAVVMDQLGLDNTLLGVDIVCDKQLIKSDATAQNLSDFAASHSVKIVVSVIGGQGHLFGRGNQQFSPQLLRAVGRDNITVLATKTKLEALEGRPLLLDTNDPELDDDWSGFIRVTTGYQDAVLYRLSSLD